MTTKKTLKTGCMAAALLAMAISSPVAWADDAQLQRPLLENYSDYNQFLIDMAAYKKQLKEQQSQTQQPVAESPRAADTGTGENTSPTPVDNSASAAQHPLNSPEAANAADESAPPPLIVNGPEDLDSAVEAAKSFPHPQYQTPRRYNRSTAQSFRLALDPEDLAGSAVPGMWLGGYSLPDDIMGLDADALDQQANVDATLRDIYRSLFAAQKAQENTTQMTLVETLVNDVGETPIIPIPPNLVIAYPSESDGVGSISGLYKLSGTSVITVHDSGYQDQALSIQEQSVNLRPATP